MAARVRLAVDGRPVEVAAGATVLDAARAAGARIPTLCHRDGLPPSPSCFLCVVRIEGWPGLWPSCATPARDGQAVTTDSPEIREARRTALELLLSEHTGECAAPCGLACPARADIAAVNGLIGAGRPGAALAALRAAVPLPGSLGRICPAYCERVCRRHADGEAVAVRALERFAADAGAGEAPLPPRAPATGKRVAVVGAGPAGLSAAWFLLLAGHECVLFEARELPGGMLRRGVPEFLLPRAALDADIAPILAAGARLHAGVRLGRDVALGDLRRAHDAVLLAVGAEADEAPSFEGIERTAPARGFLEDPAGAGIRPGAAVAVVGDGLEACAAARTAVRLGAGAVTLLCGETGGRETADERAAAAREGVRVLTVSGVRRVSTVADAAGRLSVECAGDAAAIGADVVVAAPARRADVAFLRSLGLPAAERGVAVDPATLAVDGAGLFAAGECAAGPGPAVRAVAAGRRAAEGIDRYLAGSPPAPEPVSVRMGGLSARETEELLAGAARIPRAVPPAAPAAAGDFRGAAGLAPEDARREANRCLGCGCLARDDCGLRDLAAEYGARTTRFRGGRRPFRRDDSHPDVVYEPGKCILCGLCVRRAGELGARPGIGFRDRGFAASVAVPFGGTVLEGLGGAAAACAAVCPTGALRPRRTRRGAA